MIKKQVKDYLLVDEITEKSIADIKLNSLYRTHAQLHKLKETGSVQNAHAIVADKMRQKGMLHHSWDKIDSNYQQS